MFSLVSQRKDKGFSVCIPAVTWWLVDCQGSVPTELLAKLALNYYYYAFSRMDLRSKRSRIEAIYGPSVEPIKFKLAPIEPLLEIKKQAVIVLELSLYGSWDISQTEQPVKTLWLPLLFGFLTQRLSVVSEIWIESLDLGGHL
jgi:hypothetical protein